MRVRQLHTWPADIAGARAIQERLRPLVDFAHCGPVAPAVIAGVDVAYDERSDLLAAAAVALDYQTLTVIDEAVAVGRAAFDYVPGLFAFRELPTLVKALERLTVDPDLIVCDGHGLAHPDRFGLACHLGVLADVPSVGVGKTRLVGVYDEPAAERGAWSPFHDDGEVIGRVLRTRDNVKPVFVSVGHRIDLDTACGHVLRLCRSYRLPESTRRADRLCRNALTAARAQS